MRLLAMLVYALALAEASPVVAADQPRKIIIDTDFNVMSDDGQLVVMAAQLQAEGVVTIMGITVVSGNQWHKQCSICLASETHGKNRANRAIFAW